MSHDTDATRMSIVGHRDGDEAEDDKQDSEKGDDNDEEKVAPATEDKSGEDEDDEGDENDEVDDDEAVMKTRKGKTDHDEGNEEDENDDDEEIIKSGKRRSNANQDDDGDEEDENDDDDEEVMSSRKGNSDDDEEDEKDEADGDNDEEKVENVSRGKSEEGDDAEDEEDEDEHEERERMEPRNTTVYDFDIMMAKKKEENSRKRKRRNYDIINDNDDIIADIINQMKDAVEADSEANKNKMAATKKLKLLPFIISQLRKVDLRDAFLDSDVLSVITEWLAPLPDRSLPHLNIRENLLKILIDFNLYDVDKIKSSGIGKAVMYLYKHPKETRENKQRAKQLISCWSRPIFQLDSSFTAISREEREHRDLELMSKQRRMSKQNDSSDGEGPGPSSASKKPKEGVAQKPGDKGWIPRARVPAPSMRDYVVRPRSNIDGDIGKNSKRPANMLEKYMKNQQERRRASRQQRAVNMKIDRV